MGKREGEKLNIYDIILTPDPEETQYDLKNQKDKAIKQSKNDGEKSLMQLLSTKYSEFNYSDWLIEFEHSV